MLLTLNQGIAGFEFGAIAYVLVSFLMFACHRSGITTPTPAPTSSTSALAAPTSGTSALAAATPKPEPIATASAVSRTAPSVLLIKTPLSYKAIVASTHIL